MTATLKTVAAATDSNFFIGGLLRTDACQFPTPQLRNSQSTPNSQVRNSQSNSQAPTPKTPKTPLSVLEVGPWELIGSCGVVELRSCQKVTPAVIPNVLGFP